MSADGDTSRASVLLDVEGVSAGYGGAPVVRDVSLSVREGTVVTVVGPNGSGKSTLLKALLGALRVSAGKVLLRGTEITNWDTARVVRAGVGYVPQLDDVFFPLTVEENLALGGYLLSKKEARARVEEILELFPALGRIRRRHAGKLSGGERKMLAIGRAMMPGPTLMVLDEPTANLAPAVMKLVLTEEVPRLVQSGVGVLLVEQRARDALRVADWGYVMVGGRPALSAPGSELAARDDIGDLFLGRAVAESPT